MLCYKLAACQGCFSAFISSVCCERIFWLLNKNDKLMTMNEFCAFSFLLMQQQNKRQHPYCRKLLSN